MEKGSVGEKGGGRASAYVNNLLHNGYKLSAKKVLLLMADS